MIKKGKKRYCITLDKFAQSLLEEYCKKYNVSYSAVIEGCIIFGCTPKQVGSYLGNK